MTTDIFPAPAKATYRGARANLELLRENLERGHLPRNGSYFLLTDLRLRRNQLRDYRGKPLGHNAWLSVAFVCDDLEEALNACKDPEVPVLGRARQFMQDLISQALRDLEDWALYEGVRG